MTGAVNHAKTSCYNLRLLERSKAVVVTRTMDEGFLGVKARIEVRYILFSVKILFSYNSEILSS